MEIIFTNHASLRIDKRRILIHEVFEAIRYPDRIKKKERKHFFRNKTERGTIEICCIKTEKIIKVVTAYWV